MYTSVGIGDALSFHVADLPRKLKRFIAVLDYLIRVNGYELVSELIEDVNALAIACVFEFLFKAVNNFRLTKGFRTQEPENAHEP
jgi:hypothetical protein